MVHTLACRAIELSPLSPHIFIVINTNFIKFQACLICHPALAGIYIMTTPLSPVCQASLQVLTLSLVCQAALQVLTFMTGYLNTASSNLSFAIFEDRRC